MVVQKIRDASGTAAPALLAEVNVKLAAEAEYSLLNCCSPTRLGHSTAKEQ